MSSASCAVRPSVPDIEVRTGSCSRRLPPPLAEIRDRERTGREVVHLSYHRLGIPIATKDWAVGEILMEIIYPLEHLAVQALPERMDEPTRFALSDLSTHSQDVGPASVATGAQFAYTGGTVPFPNFHCS
jgi:hypothetical protein